MMRNVCFGIGLTIMASCVPDIPEGVIACSHDSDSTLSCPSGWVCRVDMRCYEHSATESDKYDASLFPGTAREAGPSDFVIVPTDASSSRVDASMPSDASLNDSGSDAIHDSAAPIDASADGAIDCHAPGSGIPCDDSGVCSTIEICDGKDNDCDGLIDGPFADAHCQIAASPGFSAHCRQGQCFVQCEDPDFDLIGGTCVRHDDCPSSNPCGEGRCIDGTRTFTCECPTGYAGTGTRACRDINECATGTHTCDTEPKACVNDPGSYHCECPPRFMGTGQGPAGCIRIASCTPRRPGCTTP